MNLELRSFHPKSAMRPCSNPDEVITSMGTRGGKTRLSIGSHQGSVMSPYLFNLILDEITRDIHKIIPNSMLVANDIGLLRNLAL